MEAEGGQRREFSAHPTRFCKQSPSKKITSIHYFFNIMPFCPYYCLFIYLAASVLTMARGIFLSLWPEGFFPVVSCGLQSL